MTPFDRSMSRGLIAGGCRVLGLPSMDDLQLVGGSRSQSSATPWPAPAAWASRYSRTCSPSDGRSEIFPDALSGVLAAGASEAAAVPVVAVPAVPTRPATPVPRAAPARPPSGRPRTASIVVVAASTQWRRSCAPALAVPDRAAVRSARSAVPTARAATTSAGGRPGRQASPRFAMCRCRAHRLPT